MIHTLKLSRKSLLLMSTLHIKFSKPGHLWGGGAVEEHQQKHHHPATPVHGQAATPAPAKSRTTHLWN